MANKLTLAEKLLVGSLGAAAGTGIGVGGAAVGYQMGKKKERKILGDAFAGANEIENSELARKFYQLGQESTKMANYNDDVFMQIKTAAYNDEMEKIAIGLSTIRSALKPLGSSFKSVGKLFHDVKSTKSMDPDILRKYKVSRGQAWKAAAPALAVTGAGLGMGGLGLGTGAIAFGGRRD